MKKLPSVKELKESSEKLMNKLKKSLKRKTVANIDNKYLQMLALKFKMIEENSKKMSEYARKMKQLYKKMEPICDLDTDEAAQEDVSKLIKAKEQVESDIKKRDELISKIVILHSENGRLLDEWFEEIEKEHN